SAVSVTYLLYAPECFDLGSKGTAGTTISYVVGVVAAIVILAVFLLTVYRNPKASLERQNTVVLGRQLS
ncbi:MAG: carbon starvation protein A, partial [Sphaerochaetaceae bacterium]|nr:carbon starvation protein A [Sphaerochaetaceae bacterium]